MPRAKPNSVARFALSPPSRAGPAMYLFEPPAAAEKHLRDKCARHFHPQTFKGFSQSRLRKLAQDRERFVASKIYGTQLEQGLALFDQAQAILEQPASPCF